MQAGIDADWLDVLANAAPPESLVSAVHWLYYTIDTELLMKEITDSTTRISTLLEAAKQYSQMDRSPHQTADLRDLLNSTLIMLAGKIPPGITVVKEYDESMPLVPSYPAELNQVWTNLIDNAVQAMGDEGRLTIRTQPTRSTPSSRSETTGRDPGRREGPDLRAVLHHQADRPRHRAGARHRLAHRGEQAPRLPEGRLRAGATTFTVRLPLEGPKIGETV